ncbi:MAG TPA: glucose 1-dehydrogenase [Iamia sp.]|nr:glucose 1-dehydrogenase [Iamia sp.]
MSTGDPARPIDPAALFRLDGRVAVVTGGTRGIGRAVAHGFAAAGASVVVASRKAEACAAVAREITDAGHTALGVPCHLGELDDVEALVAATAERFGALDVLVNNGANPLAQPVGGYTEAAFDKSVAVNVKGPLFLIQHSLPHLRASDGAAIVNVVSAGAFLFSAGLSLYAAAKAAMVSYTRSLAAELAPDGIRVNALAPGGVDTDMVRNTGPEGAAVIAGSSLMRRLATPEEMVGPALFLASPASSFVTGTVVHADGGVVGGA